MNTRLRALTLLEVVIATALLALIAIAVVPLLVDATVASATAADDVDPTELRSLLERNLEDERARAVLPTPGAEHVLRTETDRVLDITVRRIAGGDPHHPHDWIEAQCGSTRVIRYLPLTDQAKSIREGEVDSTGSASNRGSNPEDEQ